MPQQQTTPPDTLPANFSSWDHPPDSLPANFSNWDKTVSASSQPSALSRFGENLGEQINPVSIVTGMRDVAAHPIHAAVSDKDARQAIYDKAEASFKNGDYVGGAAHLLYSFLPLVGPQLDSAGEKFASGDFAGGAGQSIGMGLTMAAPGALARVPIAKAVFKTGQALSEYAPKIGESAGKIAERGGVPAAVVAGMHGNVEGAAAGLAGSVAAPLIEKGVTGALSKTGSGMQWMGNLLSADASGIQPLPLTKSVLSNSGLMEEFQKHFNSPDHQQLALPPGPTELPVSSSAAAPEGVLPAQKIVVRDPQTGRMKVMYGSGTGPTLYQIGDSVLKETQAAESKGSLPKSKAISIMDKSDQPYINAAEQALQKENGKAPSLKDTYELAQKLKDQDSFVADTLHKQLFSGTASKAPIKSATPQRPANPVTAAGVPIDPNADLSDVMRQSIARVQASKGNTVGSASGAASDTAYFAAAKRKLGPKATISEIAQEAQRMKTSLSGLQ